MASELILPSNVEAEANVLGAVLVDPNLAPIALGSLTEADFSEDDPRHRLIFRAMHVLESEKRAIDATTVHAVLKTMHLDKEVPISYLYQLISNTLFPDNIDVYIEMVREQSVLRQLLLKFEEIQTEYAKGVSSISEFIIRSNDEITEIAQKRAVGHMVDSASLAKQVNERLQKATPANKNGLTGVDTGYRGLNDLTHGWHKGELIILAARPSVGKTALGMNFAYHAANFSKIPVAFFSCEMSAPQIMERLLACTSAVIGDHIATGNLSRDEKVKLGRAAADLAKLHIFFDDTPNPKLGDLVAKATKLKRQHPDLGLIVIDYLGRISITGSPNLENRQNEVGMISGALKTLARDLEVPVLCLAQLNRDVDKKAGEKIPNMANLRESGQIEQDADIIMLMYRPDYYDRNKPADAQNGEAEAQAEPRRKTEFSETTIDVAKNRNGATGKVTLMFNLPLSRFTEKSHEYELKEARVRSGEAFEEDS